MTQGLSGDNIPDVCQAELKCHLFYGASPRPAERGSWVLVQILLVAPVEVLDGYLPPAPSPQVELFQVNHRLFSSFWSYGCLMCSVFIK